MFMKKNVVIFSFILLGLILNWGCRSMIENTGDDFVEFELKLTHLWANHPVEIWEVTHEKLKYSNDYPSNPEGVIQEERRLTDSEKRRMSTAISQFPFSDLKEYYSDPNVLDGLDFTLEIKSSNKAKTIHISNYFQEDISTLINEMNKLFQRDNRFHYAKK